MSEGELELRFRKAAFLIKNTPPVAGTTDETKLYIYSLYKQATLGDNDTPQPWAVQLEARAKWEAWTKLLGMPRAEAMRRYIRMFDEGNKNWENHSALKKFVN